MPRHVVVLEGAYGMVEDFLYSAGDAEDWIHRNRADFSDWADKVAMGLMSAQEMKRQMDKQFVNALKQIQEARQLASANGRRMGFNHIHESLLPATLDEIQPSPSIRLVMPFPQESA